MKNTQRWTCRFHLLLLPWILGISGNVFASSAMGQKNAESKEAFYIFDVGQGGAHLAIWPGSFAFLYDAGSNSKLIHTKLRVCRRDPLQPGAWAPVFIRKTEDDTKAIMEAREVKESPGHISIEQDEERPIPPKRSAPYALHDIEKKICSWPNKKVKRDLGEDQDDSEYEEDSEISCISDQGSKKSKQDTQNTQHFIRTTLAKGDLNYLFVVLSHPDDDHISWFKGIASDNDIKCPMTVFLEGDWPYWMWPDKGNPEKGTTARTVLQAAFERSCEKPTTVEIPLYWKGVFDENRNLNHDEVINHLRSALKEKKIACPFSSLTVQQHSSDRHKSNQCGSGQTTLIKDSPLPYLTLSDYAQTKKIEDPDSVLKNIRIFHSSYYDKAFLERSCARKDKNLICAISSIDMPSIKMHAFLTGDAQKETFEAIKRSKFWKKWDKEKGWFSLVIMPHHGGGIGENEDDTGYDAMFSMFEPDILGISAGNGGDNLHPDHIHVNQIRSGLSALTEEELNDWLTEECHPVSFHEMRGRNSLFFDQFKCAEVPNYSLSFRKRPGEEQGKGAKNREGRLWPPSSLLDDCEEDERSPGLVAHQFFDVHSSCYDGSFPFISTNVLGHFRIDKEGFFVPFSNVFKTIEKKDQSIITERLSLYLKERGGIGIRDGQSIIKFKIHNIEFYKNDVERRVNIDKDDIQKKGAQQFPLYRHHENPDFFMCEIGAKYYLARRTSIGMCPEKDWLRLQDFY